MLFDIARFNYFSSGNVFTGSKETFNFRLAGEDDRLVAAVWYGMLCYAKSEIKSQNSFDFTAEGLEEAIRWLETEYGVYKNG